MNKKVFSKQLLLVIVLSIISVGSAMAKKGKDSPVKVSQDTVHTIISPILQAPVVPFRDTLFIVYGNMGSFTATERAKALEKRIRVLEEDFYFDADSLILVHHTENINLVYRNEVLFAIDTLQAQHDSMSKLEAAKEYKAQIRESIDKERHETSWQRILLQVLGVIGILVAEYFIFKFVHFLYRHARARIRLQRGKKIRGYKGIIDDERVMHVILAFASFIRFLLVVIFLYLGLLILFKLFPYTKHISDTLLDYVLTPMKTMFVSIINYMPNLFTIIVIVIAFRFLRKFLHSIAQKVAEGKLVFKGFYPDWAYPTYNIVNVILMAFLFVFIFPYLPNSDSQVFQGVSVFAGIILSLGSTSVIGNLVAGLVITYMRPFKVGDRIKMGDIVGNVLEKTALVTRLRTPKNEVITIPNSNVMNAHTLNYTNSAKDFGLILYTSVPVGYDVPWEKVHSLLLQVAKRTDNLSKKQKPFILQDALKDVGVDYQLNVYIKDANLMAKVYSDLRQNVQDVFKEAGVELLAPHFVVNMEHEAPVFPEDVDKK